MARNGQNIHFRAKNLPLRRLSYHTIGTTAISSQIMATHLRRADHFLLHRRLEHCMCLVGIQFHQLEQVTKSGWIHVWKLELQMAHDLFHNALICLTLQSAIRNSTKYSTYVVSDRPEERVFILHDVNCRGLALVTVAVHELMLTATLCGRATAQRARRLLIVLQMHHPIQ